MFHVLIKKKDGFSLIELVVVVTVLGVLSAIAIPSFNCFQRKSKATAALAAMRQIQTECISNKTDDRATVNFSPSNLNSYQIQSDGSNSCSGASGSGLISAIPTDSIILPTFILATNTNQLSYNFKGESGIRLQECLDLICGGTTRGNSNSFIGNENDPIPTSYPEEIVSNNYCISHGKITGGRKTMCGADSQHTNEQHAHWHCEEADDGGDWRHVTECEQAQKDYGCEWNSEKGRFNLSEDGKTCAEQMNDTACKPTWTKRLVCARFLFWPSSYRACLGQTSGCIKDYEDPRWGADN